MEKSLRELYYTLNNSTDIKELKESTGNDMLYPKIISFLELLKEINEELLKENIRLKTEVDKIERKITKIYG